MKNFLLMTLNDFLNVLFPTNNHNNLKLIPVKIQSDYHSRIKNRY